MKFLLGLLLAALITSAQAADNTVILTPGSGVTMRTKDVGSGVESPLNILGDTSGNALATAPGTPNSVFALPVQGVTGGVALTVSGLVTANPGTAANWGIGATGSAVPANAQYIGIISGGNLTGWTGAVTQGTAANLNATVVGTGTFAAQVNGFTSWGGSTLGAMANYGTSPGAVLVPGVNAFITNSLTVQPGNTPNTSPWLMTIHQGSNSANVSAGNALLVDASATTQPVSIASAFPLPTGASTAALQTTGNSTLTTINTSIGSVNTTLGSQATAANQSTALGYLGTIATNTGEPIPAQLSHTVNIGAVDSISPYPATAVPITASTTGTTAATTATLTNVSGHTTYICGFSIRANATSAVTGNATVTGTVTGTLNYTQWTAPNSSGLGVTEEVFSPCVPASAVSTSIAVISAAPSTGGVVSVTAWGYSI